MLANTIIMLLLSLVISSTLAGQRTVRMQSATVGTFSALLNAKKAWQTPASVNVTFAIPNGVIKEKLPAVVIMPGSEGMTRDKEGAYTDLLVKNGFAVLVVDSYGSRGIQNTLDNQAKLSLPSQVIDGFAALRSLAKQPVIDINRVGILGTSRGAMAVLQAYQQPINRLAGNKLQFSYYMAVYPCCLLEWKPLKPTNKPLLMLLGAKDNECSAQQCEQYSKNLKKAGAALEQIILPNAGHGFDVGYSAHFISTVPSFKFCPSATILPDGHILFPNKIREILPSWGDYVAALKTSGCVKRGASFGATGNSRQKSFTTVLEFAKKHSKN